MKLEYYGGDGYTGVPSTGKFHVVYNENECDKKEFTELKAARDFYDSLNCSKALWGCNTIPELLECHTLE